MNRRLLWWGLWVLLLLLGISEFRLAMRKIDQDIYEQNQHLSFPQMCWKIAMAESGVDKYAIGKLGERGLMQISRTTWEELTDLPYSMAYDGATNLQVGGKLVAQIEEKFHTTNPAYIAYRWNCGINSEITFSDWKRLNKNKVYRSLYDNPAHGI